jgi:hypothetical protein
MIHGVSPIVTLLGATAVSPCPASHVHYGADPGVERGLRSIPWIATSNGAFHAHLFYFGGTPWGISKPRSARIFTTVVQRPINPKVLWISRRGARTGRLLIRGRRLDALGSFTWRQSYRSGYQFPSYVEVPAAGCWRVTVSSGGSSGSVVFEAVDHF